MLRITTYLMMGWLILSACTRALPTEELIDAGERLTVGLSLSSSKSGASDAGVEHVRVLVFNDNGRLVLNQLTPIASASASGVAVQLAVPRGRNHFYLFCNENAELKTLLNGVAEQRDIERISFQAAGLGTPIPMYGKALNVLVKADADGSNATVTVDGTTSNTLSVAVDRLLAKVSLTVVKHIPATDDDFVVEQLRYKVCRIPKTTTIEPNKVYSGAWVESVVYTGNGQLANNGAFVASGDRYSVPTGVDQITFEDIYIPEHLLSDPADKNQASYLLIEAQCRTKDSRALSFTSSYTLHLGQAPPANHNIARNDHHNIYATIKGVGDMTAVYMAVEWRDETVPGDMVVPYLNVSELVPHIVPLKDVSGVIDMKGYTYTYYFWTNRPVDQIKVVCDPSLIGSVLVKEPVLTILKNSTTPDGVPDVAGKVEVQVTEAWIADNFHIIDKTQVELLSLHSDKVTRSLGISMLGNITPYISPLTPESGQIVVTQTAKDTFTATTTTFTFTVFMRWDGSQSAHAKAEASDIGVTQKTTNTVLAQDGSCVMTYEVTCSALIPRYVAAKVSDVTVSLRTDNAVSAPQDKIFKLEVVRNDI